MLRLALIIGLLVACNSLESEDSCPEQEPWHGGRVTCHEPGFSCEYPSWRCTCDTTGKFSCSSCPTNSCPAGTTCSFSNWEHDCDCMCTTDGTLSCSGSNCPR